MKTIKEKIKKAPFLNVIFKKIRLLQYKLFYASEEQKKKKIEKKFKKILGHDIDFSKEPETFNQKIQFRKLYDNNPLYSICSDKYKVREYVKKKIGEKYLIPLYLVTDKLTEEQWKKLPNSFVAKANHNSGPVQIIFEKNEVAKNKIIKELNNQLKIDYGVLSMEPWYTKIKRKIIVEKFLGNVKCIPKDYKFHCFNNDNKFKTIIEIIKREPGKIASYKTMFYDSEWNNLNFTTTCEPLNEEQNRPKNLEELISISKILSEDFEYVRVDLYNIKEKIYFGELTFAHSSGFSKFNPPEWDTKLGEYWVQKKE